MRFFAVSLDVLLAGLASVGLFALVDQGIFPAPDGPVVPFEPILCLVTVGGSAALLAQTGGRTPGKAVMGLRVGGPDGFGVALRREARRWIPLFLLFERTRASAWLETVEGAYIA